MDIIEPTVFNVTFSEEVPYLELLAHHFTEFVRTNPYMSYLNWLNRRYV